MGVWLPLAAVFAVVGLPARPAAPRPPIATGTHPAVFSRPDASFFLIVTPPSVTFNANNPDLMPVASGGTGTLVTWQNQGGSAGSWALAVQANAVRFVNCPTVPVSAVTVWCASATANGSKSGNCRPPFALSLAPQVVAGGSQGGGSMAYAVTLNFTLSDDWKYVAETSPLCSLSLSYTATVP